MEPVIPTNATAKVGVVPVSVGDNAARSNAVFKVIGTSVHAEIATPEEFFMVSFAVVNVPVPALVRVKDCQLRIGCELA
jgi:hypothetical protein